MANVLIVIDMQNDFIDGPLGSPEARAIIPAVRNRIKEALMEGVPVLYTRDTHEKNYLQTFEGCKLPVEHCIRGTEGQNIHPDVYSPNATRVLEKSTFGFLDWTHISDPSTCFGTCLFDGVEEIEIIGVCTDICVVSNALILRAMYPDTEITVDASCCAGTTPEKHLAALSVMQSCHINIHNMPKQDER